jgi:hypothetical protein
MIGSVGRMRLNGHRFWDRQQYSRRNAVETPASTDLAIPSGRHDLW